MRGVLPWCVLGSAGYAWSAQLFVLVGPLTSSNPMLGTDQRFWFSLSLSPLIIILGSLTVFAH